MPKESAHDCCRHSLADGLISSLRPFTTSNRALTSAALPSPFSLDAAISSTTTTSSSGIALNRSTPAPTTTTTSSSSSALNRSTPAPTVTQNFVSSSLTGTTTRRPSPIPTPTPIDSSSTTKSTPELADPLAQLVLGTSNTPNQQPVASLSAATPPVLSKAKGDFNSDGVSDLVQVDVNTKAISLRLMNGTAFGTAIDLPASTTGWTPSGFGDFNSDGKWDLVARNYTTGANAIWLMNGTTLTQTVALPPLNSSDWLLSDAGDFSNDGQWDLLWRNPKTGENVVWLMNGSSPLRTATNEIVSLALPNLLGVNLQIEGTADFNQDGQTDIIWRNYLNGENFVWLMKPAVPTVATSPVWAAPTVTSTVSLPSQSDLKWHLEAIGDWNYAKETAENKPHRPDLVWRNNTTGETRIWLTTSLTEYETVTLASQTPPRIWVSGTDYNATPPATAIVSDLVFSGREGDTGTFKIQLAQAPTSNMTLTFTTGDFLVVDADAVLTNGTQSTITFTPQNWNQARTVWFIAEVDGSSANRSNQLLNYSLSNGVSPTVVASSGVYNLGTVVNTYAPDTTRFNIDLDYRNDTTGFWTAPRRAIAQRAANDWASRIANEWAGLQLNNSVRQLSNGFYSTNTYATKRYVDDLVVFINPLNSGGVAGGYGGVEYEFGGWFTSPELMPRVGQIAIDPAVGDTFLYNAVLHELGHTLGLVGLNWGGYLQQDLTSPQTAVFKGAYAKAANGGNLVPLMSQDGPNPVSKEYDYWHPASSVQSVMSYGSIYKVSAPTAIDFAMLADSGYKVTGINA
jgi:FG-GAP-like repeat